jgi:hypothetical protein
LGDLSFMRQYPDARVKRHRLKRHFMKENHG